MRGNESISKDPIRRTPARLYAVGMSPPPRILLLISLALCLQGCTAKGTYTEADELREKIIALEKDLSKASAERDEARAKLAEAERVRLAGSADLPADVLAALPRCAGIALDGLTGLSRDAKAVDVYIKPFDGRQRFVQIVGTLTVRADLIPPATAENGAQRAPGAKPGNSPPSAPPLSLGTVTLTPTDLREAYRSSPLGTHYTVRVPVSAAVPPGATLAVTAEFLDALSGQAHRASSVAPIAR
jgi:hypothetical protein